MSLIFKHMLSMPGKVHIAETSADVRGLEFL